ncbi:odorant receptor 67a-like [Chironomus tepperi]|uniref:odorant receptor 67a-like n=1 Tax=Chironomus tepperi TaxID=113505 RepID=UPI00391F76AB
MEKFTLGINLVICMSTIVVKGIVMFYSGINFMDTAYACRKKYTASDHAKYGIDRYLKECKKFNKLYTLAWLMSIAITFVPDILNLIITGEKRYPFLIEFPAFVHADSNFVYPFLYVYLAFGFSSSTVSMVTFDLLFFNLITVISMEFDILGQEIRNLKDVEESNIPKELRKIHERQIDLYEIVDKMEKYFALPNAYNFFMISIIMCFFAFVLSTSTDSSDTMKNAVYGGSTLFQLYLQNNFAQLLINASENIHYAFYECGWENFTDIKSKKALIMCLMRTKKPSSVTLCKFGDLSLEQFRYAMLRAYSYFTLCLNVYRKS